MRNGVPQAQGLWPDDHDGAQLVCLDPDHVREVWPFAPFIERAIVRTGLSSLAAIERDILVGASLLWVAWNGAVIEAAASTSLQQTDAGEVCVITACAGNRMTRWLPLIRGIEAYAHADGCRCVRIFGRKARVLEGCEQTYAIIDKCLPHERVIVRSCFTEGFDLGGGASRPSATTFCSTASSRSPSRASICCASRKRG